MSLATLIPESLSGLECLTLILLSFFSSGLTAAMGAGGGALLLAVMAQILPIKAVIPVHGVVQLGSAVGRVSVLWRYIHWKMVAAFLTGSLMGVAIGGQIVLSLPKALLQFILGMFILYAAWGPKLTGFIRRNFGFGVGGMVTTFLSLFVGAMGPIVTALVKSFPLSPQGIVGTASAAIMIQHGLKVLTFGIIGFAFGDYLALICGMIISGFLGTLVGRQFLMNVSPEKFKRGLNVILSLLAIRLLFKAISAS